MLLDRRQFLAASAATVASGLPAQGVLESPATNKKVAAIVTTYFRYSHADNIVTRFMEGYSIVGKSFPPPCKVSSLFIEQVNDLDIGQPMARRWKIPLASSIEEALTLGTGKLAVDGVVIVGEHGDYPENDKGQRLYPRRRFLEEVVKVFRASGRSVPVFTDKHLSWNWKDAKWMYDQSKELGFPMLAGSSVPVTWRRPDLQPREVEWEQCLSTGYGHFEVYGFHTLEALQVMAEKRKGGETGVKAVTALEGSAAWQAADRWGRGLLDVAAARIPKERCRGKTGRFETDDPDALVYLIEYRDGLTGTAYMSRRALADWAFAGKVKGQAEPLSCWYDMPKPQRDHFSFLVGHAASMIVTGKAPYPIERTLLTTGMLASVVDSKSAGGKRLETPELDVVYRA